jgi:hypothetical protein
LSWVEDGSYEITPPPRLIFAEMIHCVILSWNSESIHHSSTLNICRELEQHSRRILQIWILGFCWDHIECKLLLIPSDIITRHSASWYPRYLVRKKPLYTNPKWNRLWYFNRFQIFHHFFSCFYYSVLHIMERGWCFVRVVLCSLNFHFKSYTNTQPTNKLVLIFLYCAVLRRECA